MQQKVRIITHLLLTCTDNIYLIEKVYVAPKFNHCVIRCLHVLLRFGFLLYCILSLSFLSCFFQLLQCFGPHFFSTFCWIGKFSGPISAHGPLVDDLLGSLKVQKKKTQPIIVVSFPLFIFNHSFYYLTL